MTQFSKETLSENTLWEVDEMTSVQQSLHRVLSACPESNWTERRLIPFLLCSFTKPLLTSAALELVTTTGKLLQPWLLKQFLSHPSFRVVGYMLCARVITALSSTHSLFLLNLVGVRVKSSFAALICEKVLSTSANPKSPTSSPTNLTEVDTNRIVELITMIHALWAYPLQALISLSCITYLIGWQAIVFSSLVMLFAYPILHIQTSRMHVGMGNFMAAKDKRISLTEEILTQIKPVYMLSWQKYLADKLEEARSQELHILGGLAGNQAMLMGVLGAVPELMSSVAFLSVFLKSGQLDAQSIFPTLGYWIILKAALPGISSMLPQLFTCIVSFDRIRSFLGVISSEDCPDSTEVHHGTIRADDLCFELGGQGLLSHINLEVRSPALVTVTGPAGSGKSLLCQGLLGFIAPASGKLTLSGRLAYVPQTPWLVRGSIRDNIIFGRQFESDFYMSVLRACALDIDISEMQGGDDKPVGGLGVALSGGQMSRISIARALYSRAAVYIFDDPLAALDAKVKAHILEHVFSPQGMLANALCVVVTNHSSLVRASHYHFNIEDGRFCEVKPDLIDISLDNTATRSDIKTHDSIVAEPLAAEDIDSETVMPEDRNSIQQEYPPKDKGKVLEANTTLTVSQWSIYRSWLGKAHPAGWFAVFVLIVAGKISSGYSTYLLSVLAGDTGSAALHDLAWFTVIGLLQSLFSAAFLMVTYHLCLIPAATKMHAALACSVLKKPLSYFATRSIGSVLNLFTNDIGKLDGTITSNFLALLMVGSNLGLVIIVLLIPSPIALAYLMPLGFVYFAIQARYLQVACQIRRLELETRIPIIDSIHMSQSGRQSILLYGQRNRFLADHYSTINNNVRMMVISSALEGWLLLRLDIIGSLVQVLSALSMLWLGLDSAKLGFVMNYSMQATAMFQALVKYRTNLELDIVSVERIERQWEPNIDTKSDDLAADQTIYDAWPRYGEVSLRGYSASYPNMAKDCLTDVSLEISPGQKVAIVGRTGSGKSSLVLGVMGFLEQKSGMIQIDGVDITALESTQLRSRLSVVPQDIPVLKGTLRANLDPSGTKSDDELLEVIQDCGLRVASYNDDDILDIAIAEGGTNLSRGQLQLLAIARALLKSSKIVILDEATASLDSKAENYVHDLFQSKLKHTTVIAIIHRLERITSYDRVIVLDSGRVIEFGSPLALAQTQDSALSHLINAS
ncbi:hypothetical protein PFICI_10798 [Pestalotiopsis fici W106-1]|uniref:P-loop containing nucleoside triphosphate hydrolase protein n=1 Tax=Pestalotiopsis fici (strain W106-1 / CGMCC3.15140) TaxID=1229662 RepID=W3WSX8_PESFW|nr:uncharacterized protein PFICI_10798 [Pestalotiopsis fici W106-1]ETS76924.1 hypothetical protein PFICI_10798 [Pestalotiopsis fici W106-1]